MIEAYKNAIQNVTLWGPTNVAPIIYHVARFAEAAQKEEATKGAHVCIFGFDQIMHVTERLSGVRQ